MDFTKAMFGEHAIHVPCQIVLQEQGRTADGRYLTLVVGVVSSTEPILSPEAIARDFPHELIVGDMVIRPHGKWASAHFKGCGATGLVTSGAMFPDGHEIQTLDNGYDRAGQEAREMAAELTEEAK